MTDATKYQFTTPSVPKAYDEFFVPRLFEPWAKLLLDEVNLQPGEAVLDVATGPGTVARLAAVRLGSQGRVVATDIALPMLDIARAKPVVAGAARIEYLESPAAPLAAPRGTFDAVLCQQGLQFFPDRPGALREMHRVLKPNGRAAIAVWAELERNQIFAAYHAALHATVPACELDDGALQLAERCCGEAGRRRSRFPRGPPVDPDAADGAGRRPGPGCPVVRCHTRVAGCCRASTGCTGSFLRTGAARDGPAGKRWQGHWRNDFKYYHSQLLVRRTLQ